MWHECSTLATWPQHGKSLLWLEYFVLAEHSIYAAWNSPIHPLKFGRVYSKPLLHYLSVRQYLEIIVIFPQLQFYHEGGILSLNNDSAWLEEHAEFHYSNRKVLAPFSNGTLLHLMEIPFLTLNFVERIVNTLMQYLRLPPSTCRFGSRFVFATRLEIGIPLTETSSRAHLCVFVESEPKRWCWRGRTSYGNVRIPIADTESKATGGRLFRLRKSFTEPKLHISPPHVCAIWARK